LRIESISEEVKEKRDICILRVELPGSLLAGRFPVDGTSLIFLHRVITMLHSMIPAMCLGRPSIFKL